jgi:hypothetical protein
MLDAQQAGAANQEELDSDFLPIAWKETYKEQIKGPKGETLPDGAEGWLITGKPDFGGGFTGVWKGALYSLWDKPRGEFDVQSEVEAGLSNFTERLDQLVNDPNLAPGVDLEDAELGDINFGNVIKNFGGVVAAAYGEALDAFRNVWTQAEDNTTVFSDITRFIGAGMDLVLGSVEEVGKHVEREFIGPSLIASDEILRKGLDAGTIPAGEEKWLEFFRKGGALTALAPLVTMNRLRLQGLLDGREYIDIDEFRELRDSNRDAAHMAYTAWWDPAVKAEFDRQFKAGTDPRLLAMELENPGAEMVGRALWDPLNIFDLFQFGPKIARMTGLRRARRYTTTKPSVLNAFNEFANAGEATSDAALRKALDEVGTMIDEAQSGVTDLGGSRGIGQTAGHKRANLGQRSVTVMSAVISATHNKPDITNSVWHALVQIQDADTRVEGLTRLSQAIRDADGALPADMLLSPAANETGLVLRKILTNDAGDFDPNVMTKLIADADGDPGKLAELLDNKLKNTLDDIHPTVQEQVKLNEEYAELRKADDAAVAEAAKAPAKETVSVDLPTETEAVHPVTRVIGKAPSIKADNLVGTVKITNTPGGISQERAVGGLHRTTFAGVSKENPSFVVFTQPGTQGKVNTFVHIDDLPPEIRAQIEPFLPGAKRVAAAAPSQAADFLAKNPLADRDPGALIRGLAKADGIVQPLYRRMGDFQSRLYMGTAPASIRYRANNRWGNFVPALIDLGKVAFKGLFEGAGRFVKRMGVQASLDNIANELGGIFNEGALRGLGPGASFRGGDDLKNGDWFSNFTKSGLRAAARDEASFAAHASSKSVSDTMRSYMKAERALVNEALADFPKPLRDLWANVYRDSFYSASAASDAVRADDGYDIARNLSFLNDEQVSELKQLGLYEEARRIARENDALDDIVRQIDELVEDRRTAGRVAMDETPVNAMDDTTGMGTGGPDNLTRSADSNAISEFEKNGVEAADMFDRRVNANRFVDTQWDEALYGKNGLQSRAQRAIHARISRESRGLRMSEADEAQALEAALEGFTGTVNPQINELHDATFASADSYRKAIRLTSQNSTKRPNPAWLSQKWEEYSGIAQNMGLPGFGPVPDNLKPSQLRDALWDHPTSNFRAVQQARYTQLKEDKVRLFRELANRYALGAEMDSIFTQEVINAETAYTNSVMLDRAQLVDGRMVLDFPADANGLDEILESLNIDISLPEGLLDADLAVIKETVARQIAFTLQDTDEGAQILDNLYGGDLETFADDILYRTGIQIGDPPPQENLEAIAVMLGNNPDIRSAIRNIGDLEQAGDDLRIPLMGAIDDAAPTGFRALHETQPAARDAGDRLIAGIRENWGARGPTGALAPELEAALSELEKAARGRRTIARLNAASQANDTRDFILHNYPARYGIDLAVGYIWPYQFWHSRTYVKWMKRMMMHPGLMQAYADYRANMEKRHAGLPPWWRRNINVTELLGLDVDTPLWFNLEQTLNPLNGLTGVDFNDPKKRLDMWSATVDDLNKFGPTVWMPYQVALGLKYHIDGEEEAASRWTGRAWSPTGTFKDLTALIDPKGIGIELDPFIHLFSGGIGPYERGRIGRQLTALEQQNPEMSAEIIDAAFAQSGPIWDQARAMATNLRSPNVLAIAAPFFLGGGFKPRTEEDAQIDMFYGEMFGIIRQKEDLTPDEYRQKWNDLERRYPFMDTLLLAKKAGPERDEAMAWTVLDRIPPGMRDQIAEMVGIDSQIIQNFYDNNSDIEEMTEAERNLFMGAVLEIAAILDVPDQATKAEWEASKGLYGEMQELGQELFGEDIWEKADTFFAIFDPENPEAGDAYLQQNPVVSEALDWQTRVIQITPLLGAYYTSAERIRKFYKRQMYDTAETMFGEDIWDHIAVQGALFDMGERQAAFQYRDDHPQLKAYSEFRDSQLPIIEGRVNRLDELLPEAVGPAFRDEDEGPPEIPDAPPTPSREDWINAQVLSYVRGEEADAPDLSKVEATIIRVADEKFPETKTLARRYYSIVEKDPEKAADILLENTAVAARIAWEVQALESFRETTQGNVALATQGLTPEQIFGPVVARLIDDLELGDPLPLVVQEIMEEAGIEP